MAKRRKSFLWGSISGIFRFFIWSPVWFLIRLVPTRIYVVIFLSTLAFVAFERFTPSYWLGLAMYYEARDEGLYGRVAVAEVILKREEDSRWPSTVKGVVDDGRERGKSCDFSFRCDGKPDNPWLHDKRFWGKWMQIRAEAIFIIALQATGLRHDITEGAVYYKRSDVYSPWFAKEIAAGRMTKVQKDFGSHEFFK